MKKSAFSFFGEPKGKNKEGLQFWTRSKTNSRSAF